ncbi:MAG: hypothetical protein ABJN26_01225 [Stappiaceae bacterium]
MSFEAKEYIKRIGLLLFAFPAGLAGYHFITLLQHQFSVLPLLAFGSMIMVGTGAFAANYMAHKLRRAGVLNLTVVLFAAEIAGVLTTIFAGLFYFLIFSDAVHSYDPSLTINFFVMRIIDVLGPTLLLFAPLGIFLGCRTKRKWLIQIRSLPDPTFNLHNRGRN